ncbi:MAG: hypothetical protein LV480_05700 [Methylacidiphilales bacterium]|nr:hypothetical protein [Candidatus Methylacidiphilales bacterium]
MSDSNNRGLFDKTGMMEFSSLPSGTMKPFSNTETRNPAGNKKPCRKQETLPETRNLAGNKKPCRKQENLPETRKPAGNKKTCRKQENLDSCSPHCSFFNGGSKKIVILLYGTNPARQARIHCLKSIP